jgi:predicted DNA-binding protein YlxM (UPF0122 family)
MSIAKALRLVQMEKLLLSGLTHGQIAEKIGCSRQTITRYLRIRKDRMLASFGEKQAIIHDTLVRESMQDHDRLGELIDQEKNLRSS